LLVAAEWQFSGSSARPSFLRFLLNSAAPDMNRRRISFRIVPSTSACALYLGAVALLACMTRNMWKSAGAKGNRTAAEQIATDLADRKRLEAFVGSLAGLRHAAEQTTRGPLTHERRPRSPVERLPLAADARPRCALCAGVLLGRPDAQTASSFVVTSVASAPCLPRSCSRFPPSPSQAASERRYGRATPHVPPKRGWSGDGLPRPPHTPCPEPHRPRAPKPALLRWLR